MVCWWYESEDIYHTFQHTVGRDRSPEQQPLSLFEQAAKLYLAQGAKHDRDAKDAAILERYAERLNREAADVLEYQDLPE